MGYAQSEVPIQVERRKEKKEEQQIGGIRCMSTPVLLLSGERHCCCTCAVYGSGRYKTTAGSVSPSKQIMPTTHRSSMFVPALVSSYSRMAGCCPSGEGLIRAWALTAS